MSNEKIDKLIKGLIDTHPRLDRLQTMESRVWQSINRLRADMPRNVIEGWLASLFVPEYRLASLSFDPPPINESRNSYGNAIHNGLFKGGAGYGTQAFYGGADYRQAA